MLPLPDLDQLDVAAKDALIRALWDKVQSLTTQVQSLLTRVAELEAKLAKDSRNSSKPPSSDGLRKPKSLRKAGQNPPGGQQGHTGNTLKRVMQPDRTVTHPLPPTCDACGSILPTGEIATETRQVFDLPPARVEVTEHRILEARCTCGKAHRGSFPADVAATAQYGSNIKALVVYLTQHHMMPILRTSQLMDELYGVSLCAGTIMSVIREAQANLSPVTSRIAGAIQTASVAGFDETGMRVAGKLHWLHAAVTETLTWMDIHPRRGKVAFDHFGILPNFTGRAIHDGWKPYREFDCLHGLCNAHHLRELTFVHEELGQVWAKDMIDLLCAANDEVAVGPLSQSRTAQIRTAYEAILVVGESANPALPQTGRRGPTAQSFPTNLLRRLRGYEDDTLRFISDPEVPFTNNLAEQAVRMPKVKQKISGCFRTFDGAHAFCVIRSYLATLRKQQADLFQSLVLSFQGSTPLPRFSG